MLEVSRRSLLGVAAASAFPASWAQDVYPSKPVKIVNPNTVGGAPDIIARHLAQRLGEMWNQSVFVENRPGAGNSIGADYVARQRPDGYTLLIAGIASHAIVPAIYRTVPYDPLRDFTPVTLVATFANVLAAAPSFPAANLEDLIAQAKANPGKFSYASPGNGTSPHLAGEYFCQMAGIQMVHVPFLGSPEALTSVLGGQVPLMFDTLVGGSLNALRAGKIKGYGVTSVKRSPFMPELRTIDESGVRGYELEPWAGIYGPANLPDPIIQRVNKDVRAILAEPATVEKLASAGTVARGSDPAEMRRLNVAELEKYRALAQRASIKIG